MSDQARDAEGSQSGASNPLGRLVPASTQGRIALVVLLAAVVVLAAVTNPRVTGARCGTERWQVKTLSDRRSQVDFVPLVTTVGELRRQRRRVPHKSTARTTPIEKSTYALQVALRAFRLESTRDITLIVADPRNPSKTLLAAFPDTGCRGAISSGKKRVMKTARAALVEACGKPPKEFARLSGSAVLTGVGFFGPTLGRGTAPNGIQLHPILSFASTNCRPSGSKAGA